MQCKILNVLDPELQLINTKPVIKSQLKGSLNKLKKSKVQTVLGLGYKKRNDSEIFNSSTKIIASDLDINQAYKSIHQSIITKIKKYVCEDYLVLGKVIKHSIKIVESCY